MKGPRSRPSTALSAGCLLPLSGRDGEVAGLYRARALRDPRTKWCIKNDIGRDPLGLEVHEKAGDDVTSQDAGPKRQFGEASPAISILIADDHGLLREGLRDMLELDGGLRVVGEAEDGLEAVRLATELMPDVVLMDIGLPGLNGVAATRAICAKCPSSKVIIVTMYDDAQFVEEAERAGARGYVLKNASRSELVDAIRVVHEGRPAFHQPTTAAGTRWAGNAVPVAPLADEGPLVELSSRELEVLRLLARGDSNEDIASTLYISVNTVKSHVKSIFLKLGVAHRAEAVARAMRLGLLL